MQMRSFIFGNVLPLSFIVFLLAFLFLPDAEAVPARAAKTDRFSCEVAGVYDGDGPIYCRGGIKIRLTAIAALELDDSCRPSHPCPTASGAEARQALADLAIGQRLTCEATGENYGRINAWCWREDGVELNCAMVRSGTALHWSRYDPANRLCAS